MLGKESKNAASFYRNVTVIVQKSGIWLYQVGLNLIRYDSIYRSFSSRNSQTWREDEHVNLVHIASRVVSGVRMNTSTLYI